MESNATKIVMPVSDEGPFNGDEGSDAQYTIQLMRRMIRA